MVCNVTAMIEDSLFLSKLIKLDIFAIVFETMANVFMAIVFSVLNYYLVINHHEYYQLSFVVT